jgi:AcrR family transcriptional regulator
MHDRPKIPGIRGARAVQRILGAAARRFGGEGYDRSSLRSVAVEAGVGAGTLRSHFPSKEHLLVEAQRAAFRELHRRFLERARRGEVGMGSALDALDSLYQSVRELRGGAPFIVETLSLAGKEGELGERVRQFYGESTNLLEDAIEKLFAQDLERLAVPPDRMAVLIRLLLEGLVVELAHARSENDLRRIDQAYQDLRELFERFVLAGVELPGPTAGGGPAPLPW